MATRSAESKERSFPLKRVGEQSREEEDFFHWHNGKNTLDLDCGGIGVNWSEGSGLWSEPLAANYAVRGSENMEKR